jgi:hypothetical protein
MNHSVSLEYAKFFWQDHLFSREREKLIKRESMSNALLQIVIQVVLFWKLERYRQTQSQSLVCFGAILVDHDRFP